MPNLTREAMAATSEKHKMLAGELYCASDPELAGARKRARELTRLYNVTTEDEVERRQAISMLQPHPTDPRLRATRLEYARSIRIEDNAWLGGGTIICPGVTVGRNTTIGAGSVVTGDVPADVVAAGNPCRVIRKLPAPAPG
jgi:UDP-3-O-[3-hydroxymyristoyl] glucosamine N-acyltransferase